MTATNPITGTASLAERTHPQSLVFKALARRIAATTRCGLPGIVIAFDPVTQYAQVRLAIAETIIKSSGGTEEVQIDDLYDVLVMFPGDANWCLTFPNVVGSECYVCFADMCINYWSAYGFQKNSNGEWVPQGEQISRRHDLSDGFAILAPRSQPNKIPNFSTTAVELRSMDNHCKIALASDNSIRLTGSKLVIENGTIITQPGNTPSTSCIPITINGAQYYVRLSTAP